MDIIPLKQHVDFKSNDFFRSPDKCLFVSLTRYKGGKREVDLIRFINIRSEITFDHGIFMRPIIDLESYNFERIIKDRTKNVLIFYYNGFCKLCKKMQYTIHQLGQTFSNEPDCVVARLDCDVSAEICLDQIIPHFPTIKVRHIRYSLQ